MHSTTFLQRFWQLKQDQRLLQKEETAVALEREVNFGKQ